MADPDSTESPLEAADGTADPRATDAFELLSNETRLAILMALWEAYDPYSTDNTVSFSELRERVGTRDSGRFNYHLDKLTGEFVDDTDEGYRLRNAGNRIVQAVVAGAGLEDRTLEPSEIGVSCHRCGAPVEISYDEEHLYLQCSECEGKFGPGFTRGLPSGTLAGWEFTPAGLTRRTPSEIFAAGRIASDQALESYHRGVCPECSGTVTESVRICDSHEAERGEICPNCDTPDEVRVRYACSVCKAGASCPASAAVHAHPAVDAFCYEQGIDLTYHADDPEACTEVHQHYRARDYTLVSRDPVRIRVTVPGDDATLSLTLDGELDVVDVTEREREAA